MVLFDSVRIFLIVLYEMRFAFISRLLPLSFFLLSLLLIWLGLLDLNSAIRLWPITRSRHRLILILTVTRFLTHYCIDIINEISIVFAKGFNFFKWNWLKPTNSWTKVHKLSKPIIKSTSDIPVFGPFFGYFLTHLISSTISFNRSDKKTKRAHQEFIKTVGGEEKCTIIVNERNNFFLGVNGKNLSFYAFPAY